MSADTILWTLLGLTVLTQIISAAFSGANAEVVAEMRAASRLKVGVGQMLSLFLIAVASLTLWVWYSVLVHDWRFAAIEGLGIVAGWITRGAVKRVAAK